MPIINHVLIAVSYTVVAGAIAVTLPQYMAAISPRLALEIGGMLLLACTILHLAMARLGRDQAVTSELVALKGEYDHVRRELGRARDEARRIHEAIETATQKRDGQAADLGEVMTEVKVLQGLVEQISTQSAVPQAAARPDAAPAVALAGGDRSRPPPRVMTGLGDAQILDIVREGLRNNRVDLFIQPIVSLPQRKRRHYECFSRIRAGDDSMVVPEQYLAIAEREGLIAAIDNMLLFRGVQLVRRTQRLRRHVGIFVNISEHTLADTRFFREFVAFMAANQELAPSLVFEFAQAHVARHGEPVMLELERLARLGFRFSMDQVTNIAIDPEELSERHFRFVKIDVSRLLAATRDAEPRLDIKAFKATLDRNGIDLIAEKIESDQMLVELLDMPIDFGQGYLFGEPRPARDD
ncbi:MAG: EAL domain-containing protein [Rhodospirillales bacterium]|nr:EAL domain-containing protein [Rhodospirillales bacterium]